LRGATWASAEHAAASLRTLLARLLDASGTSTRALRAVARATSVTTPDAIVAELEAALIPVNRAAARRALARLSRDTLRANAERAAHAPTATRAPSTSHSTASAPLVIPPPPGMARTVALPREAAPRAMGAAPEAPPAFAPSRSPDFAPLRASSLSNDDAVTSEADDFDVPILFSLDATPEPVAADPYSQCSGAEEQALQAAESPLPERTSEPNSALRTAPDPWHAGTDDDQTIPLTLVARDAEATSPLAMPEPALLVLEEASALQMPVVEEASALLMPAVEEALASSASGADEAPALPAAVVFLPEQAHARCAPEPVASEAVTDAVASPVAPTADAIESAVALGLEPGTARADSLVPGESFPPTTIDVGGEPVDARADEAQVAPAVLSGAEPRSPSEPLPLAMQSSADRLLDAFEASGRRTDTEVAAQLKSFVGLEPTPPPPHVSIVDTTRALAPLANDERKGAPALSPQPAARGGRLAATAFSVVLFAGVAVLVAAWEQAPALFKLPLVPTCAPPAERSRDAASVDGVARLGR
jgi:hypothetical protein